MSTLQNCQVFNIPGPMGPPGPAASNGAAGSNAWASLAVAFTMPVQNGTGVAVLDHTDWLALNEPVFIETLGTLIVQTISAPNVTLLNPQNGAGLYVSNAPAGTVAPSTSRVTPTGLQGPSGALSGAAGGDLTGTFPDPSLKNVGSSGTTGDSTHVARITTDSQGRVTAVSSVAISYPGTGGSAGGDLAGNFPNPVLVAVGSAGIYGTPQLIPQITTDAKGRVIAATGLQPRLGVLGFRFGCSTAGGVDLVIPIAFAAKYRITEVLVESPSADVHLATVSILNGAGSITVASDQALTDLTATTKFLKLALNAAYKDILTDATALFRIGTPVAAQSCNCWIFGQSLS